MRPLRFSPVVALLLALAAPGGAFADPERVGVSQFKPTQIELGKEFALHSFVDGWKKEAAAEGLTLRAWAPRLQARYRDTRVPVVIAPDGAVRNVDMHHRLFALREFERQTGVSLELGIKVIKDYRGESFDAYAHDFAVVRGLGWFGVDAPASPAARMKILPESFDRLRDNPLRAAVGEVMENEVGIDPDGMALYYEFRIAALLGKRGVTVKPGTAITPRVLARVRRAIFSDAEVTKFVRDSRGDASRDAVGEVIDREVKSASRPARTRLLDKAAAARTAVPRAVRAARARVRARGAARHR